MAPHLQASLQRHQAVNLMAPPAPTPTLPPRTPFWSGSGERPATTPDSAPCGAAPSAISRVTTSGRLAALRNWAISLLEQLEPASCCCGIVMIPRPPSAALAADADFAKPGPEADQRWKAGT
ncbi:MAG: hypothetical protein QOH32_451 [Bradyrhizobium sp.]|jgi:hypothetical protein|nr:hypothetical protein [Bradyrhizobium sp.]